MSCLRQQPERVAQLHARADLFLSLAKEHGLNTGLEQRHTGCADHSRRFARLPQTIAGLGRRGINVQPIVHPAVEEKAARLRFFITANHSVEQIRYTIGALAEELAEIDAAPPASPNGRGEPATSVPQTPRAAR